MEERIQKLMKTLNISRAEALEVLADDKRIDRDEKLFELPDDLKAGAKKARQADRKPTTAKREKKIDNDKLMMVEALTAGLSEWGIEAQIINPEREFLFTYNEKKYKVVLSCPRS